MDLISIFTKVANSKRLAFVNQLYLVDVFGPTLVFVKGNRPERDVKEILTKEVQTLHTIAQGEVLPHLLITERLRERRKDPFFIEGDVPRLQLGVSFILTLGFDYLLELFFHFRPYLLTCSVQKVHHFFWGRQNLSSCQKSLKK